MKFADQPPSTQWAALKYREELVAWVWFKPDGEPLTVRFCIPQESFRVPYMSQRLTLETLVKSVAIAPEEIDSWRWGELLETGRNGSNPELKRTLSPPPEEDSHLYVDVRLTPGSDATAAFSAGETGEGESAGAPTDAVAPLSAAGSGPHAAQGSLPPVPEATWQKLELHWKAILTIEANIETVRRSTASLVNELESLSQTTLSIEERTDAVRMDITRWEQAKKRIPFSLPKLNDFIHRSVWAFTAPERKHLEALYKEHIEPQIPFPHLANVLNEQEALQKARQVLLALGHAAYQEGKAISTEAQAALQTLRNNAVANGRKRRDAARGGKFFKDVRRMSGL